MNYFKRIQRTLPTSILIGVTLILTSMPLIVNAQCEGEPESWIAGILCARQTATDAGLKTDEGLTGNFAENILQQIIKWLFGIAATVALAVLVWGAFTYIVSLGQEDRTRKAKNIILFAIIGLIVLGLSFTILYDVMCIIVGGGWCPTTT